MTSQANLERWTVLARGLLDQVAVAESEVEKQLATEMAAMATDFVDRAYHEALYALLDNDAPTAA